MIPKIFQQITYPLFWSFLKIFLNHEVIGLEKLKGLENKGLIFVSPHRHFLDPIIYGYSLPIYFAPIRFIAAQEYFNFFKGNPAGVFSPIVALYVRINGSIPVKRGDKTMPLDKKLEKAVEILKNNGKIWIFPEGKIIKSQSIEKFKVGAVFLHKNTSAPIIPVISLINEDLFSLNFKNFLSLFLRKKTLTVKFGEPIFNLETEDLEEGAKILRNEVKRLIEAQNYKMLDPNFWARYFEVYDILNVVIPYQKLLSDLLEILSPKKGELILDAGGGTGNLSVLIKNKGAEVINLDFSQEALNIYKKKNPEAKVLLHNLIEPLPFPDNYFDKIVSNNVLYNIPPEERLKVITEFKRVLKPGGLLVISNIHKNFKPINIYIEAIKSNINKEGLIKTIYLMSKLLIPTLKMFYYNRKIQKIHKFEKNNLFDFNEQKNLLLKAKFSFVSETKLVYAGQAILNYAKK